MFATPNAPELAMKHRLAALAAASVLCTSMHAFAQQPPADEPRPQLTLQPLPPLDTDDKARPAEGSVRDLRDEAPRLNLVESPYGLSRWAAFAALTGSGVSARSANEAEGGVRLGLSPLNGLSLHGYVGRDSKGTLAPTFTGHYRIIGSLEQGYAIGALAQYKTEGFTEAGGEAEIGGTFGLRTGKLSLTGNLVAGIGVEDEEVGELDGETKLRFAYAINDTLSVGAEGQGRSRLAGDRRLAGNRTFDVLGGPMMMVTSGPLVVMASGGPSTVGVPTGVGAYGMLTIGGVAR